MPSRARAEPDWISSRFSLPLSSSGILPRMRLALIAACLVAVAGCGPSVTVIDLAAYRQPCDLGVAQDLCLQLVRGSTTYSAEPHIEGFTFQWGHAYTLEVEHEREAGPIPADGPGGRTRLRQVLKDELVPDGTEFTLHRVQPPFIEVVGATRGRFMDGQGFSCATETLCSDLRALLAKPGHYGELTFAFAVGATVEPVLRVID